MSPVRWDDEPPQKVELRWQGWQPFAIGAFLAITLFWLPLIVFVVQVWKKMR